LLYGVRKALIEEAFVFVTPYHLRKLLDQQWLILARLPYMWVDMQILDVSLSAVSKERCQAETDLQDARGGKRVDQLLH